MNSNSTGHLGTIAKGFVGVAFVALGQSAAHAAVQISPKPTSNMTCSDGVCTPTSKKAVLNVADLADMLANGSATIKSSQLAQDIEVDTKLSWTNTNKLTLDAYRSITVNRPVVVMGAGSLTLTTNDGGTGGNLRFAGKGNAKFFDTTSNLTIDGNRYLLMKTFQDFKRELHDDGGSGRYFAQVNNWKLSRTVYSSSPLGAFNGTFEGLGHVISHLTIHQDASDTSTALGFFSGMELSADVRNVRFTDADVRGTGQRLLGVGVLAGGSGAFVFNTSVDGNVSSAVSSIDIGGLLGRSGGFVSNCSSGVIVAGNSGTLSGGLIGHNMPDGVVQGSYSTGSVTGGSAVGGLIGKTEGGDISNSYSMAAVTGSDGASTGGLIGSYAPGDSTSPTLSASYSTGAVSSGTSIGGLIGQDLVGSGITNSYWDLDTSGVGNSAQGAGNIPNDPGITGLTTAELQSGLPAGFDSAIWREKAKIDGGLPYLIINTPE